MGEHAIVICLLSIDLELNRTLHDICHEIDDPKPEVVIARSVSDIGDPDILILDWLPDLSGAEPYLAGHRCLRLYLIEPQRIQTVQGRVLQDAAGVLVKPVSRAALRLSLEQAMALLTNGKANGAADDDGSTRCLLRAYLRLQEYDYERANFLARAVRDLRAPLTAVNGYCELLLEGLLGPLTFNQKDALEQILQGSRRLSGVATNMLGMTLGRPVEARAEIHSWSLADCVQGAIDGVGTLSEDREIWITTDFKEPGAPLWFDAGRIEQLVGYLLETACMYAPRGGVVKVTGYPVHPDRQAARESATEFRVDISDSGPEIPANLLPLFFDENPSPIDAKERSGSGLSLAICRMIVRSHGGRIWASSAPEGVTVSFVLPLKRRAAELISEE